MTKEEHPYIWYNEFDENPASYVLMDSWFTHAPLITEIVQKGLDVMGMVKRGNQRYRVGKQLLFLDELYTVATVVNQKKGILRSIHTELSNGIPVFVVFVRHRSHAKEWLAILSTDCTLTVKEVIQIYGIRWDIETFFKCTKSLLKLQKEIMTLSYDTASSVIFHN